MDQNNFKAFSMSCLLHLLLGSMLLIGVNTEKPRVFEVSNPVEQKPIIKAGLVDHKQVEAAIVRQERQEKDRKKYLALQKTNTEKLKKEAEKAKLEVKAAKKEAEQLRKKLEVEKKQIADEKKKAAAIKAQAAKEQAKALAEKQAMAQAQQKAAQRQAWVNDEVENFIANIKQSIEDNRIKSSAFPPGLSCGIKIRLLADGSVSNVSVVQSSGNTAYDAMSEAAVYKAAPFNMPEDQELLSKLINTINNAILGFV